MDALPDVEEAVNGANIATAPKSLDRFKQVIEQLKGTAKTAKTFEASYSEAEKHSQKY